MTELESHETRLSDDVVSIRPMTPADVEAHLAGEDDAQVRWLSGQASTRQSVAAWIERNRQNRQAGGPVFNFGIEENASHQLVGMVEANTAHASLEGIGPGEANISYGLYPHARGKGHATRAVNLMLRFLAGRGLTGAVIRVEPESIDSLQLPERCGFERAGSITAKDGKELLVFRRQLTMSRS